MEEPRHSGQTTTGAGLAFEPITTLLDRLDTGEVSSRELTDLAIDRLERIGRRLNAVAELAADRAREQARQADASRSRGEGGALCGIPWAPKDLLATVGIPTRWGAPPFRDQGFDFDATVVRRLSDAGAVLVGKLSMVEMAGAGLYRYASASIDGPCHNPWDPDRWSGGSSSGSAAAVAAGLVPFSIGSETAGSLTIPSSFCGLTGLRPSFGVVSVHGAQPVAWSLDKLGPICRSAQDCALVLSAIGGRDPLDTTTVDWTNRPDEGSPFRLGVLMQTGGDASIQEAFRGALRALESLGMELVEVVPPDLDLIGLHDRLVAGETAYHHEDFILGPERSELIDAAQRETLAGYLRRPITSYPAAVHERVGASQRIREMFADVDAVVSPTLLTEAVGIDEDLLEYRQERRGGNMFLGSIAGIPELTLPMGVGRHGLPVGLSIMGDVLQDSTVLRIGALYQSVTSWHARHPTLPEDQ